MADLVYLVNENSDESAGWYDPDVARVLLAQNNGWSEPADAPSPEEIAKQNNAALPDVGDKPVYLVNDLEPDTSAGFYDPQVAQVMLASSEAAEAAHPDDADDDFKGWRKADPPEGATPQQDGPVVMTGPGDSASNPSPAGEPSGGGETTTDQSSGETGDTSQ